MKELNEREWYERFPDREPVKLQPGTFETNEVYHANTTHNLTSMASTADLYDPLWRPEEVGITKAGQLIEHLTKGLEALGKEPDYFRTFNAENGWGTYGGLVRFVARYLKACIAYPDADVSICR